MRKPVNKQQSQVQTIQRVVTRRIVIRVNGNTNSGTGSH